MVVYSQDLELARSKILAAGGKVTREIFSFPGGRRFHFTDLASNELAVWSIQGRKGEILLPQRRSDYQATANQPDGEGLGRALSQALSLLCREIAEQVAQEYNLENK